MTGFCLEKSNYVVDQKLQSENPDGKFLENQRNFLQEIFSKVDQKIQSSFSFQASKKEKTKAQE